MNPEYMGACPYCGQLVAIGSGAKLDPEEQIREAGRRCACDGAARARKIAESHERISMACGQDSVQNGFDYPLSDSAVCELKALAERIVDGVLSMASVQDGSGDVVRLKDGIQWVSVVRTQKKTLKL